MRTLSIALIAVSLAARVAAAEPAPAVVAAEAYRFIPGGIEDPTVPLRIEQGGSLTFVNLDVLGAHQITAVDLDALGRPLFDSGEQINSGESSEVSGVDALPLGFYAFYCVTHGLGIMDGKLEIIKPS